MIDSADPAHPIFISEWPSSAGRAKIVLTEKRFLRLAAGGASIAIWPFLVASALSTLRGCAPGLSALPSGAVVAESVGCVALPAGLIVALVALVSLQRLRGRTGSLRRTVLYLRPKDDDTSRKILENALYTFVGSRIRILQLADQESNVTTQSGVVVRLLVSVVGVTFLLLTLELFELIPKGTEVIHTALGMMTAAVMELGYRKNKRATWAKGMIGTLEKLEAEIRRAESAPRSVVTFAPSVSIWTHAIRRLVPLADVILLDVSRPGSGLAWELSYCLATKCGPPTRSAFCSRSCPIASWT